MYIYIYIEYHHTSWFSALSPEADGAGPWCRTAGCLWTFNAPKVEIWAVDAFALEKWLNSMVKMIDITPI